jgi:hypothetical protein
MLCGFHLAAALTEKALLSERYSWRVFEKLEP